MTKLETDILRTLKAYKIEKGAAEGAADAFAAARLAEAVARFSSVREQRSSRRDPEAGSDAAFADLKVWAQSL